MHSIAMARTEKKTEKAESEENIDARQRALSQTVDEIKEKFGEGAILTLGEAR
ncbi:MAG: hypothetical protein HY475_00155 [Candidatus Terrybacteria bacterium]|nr:hypothetical protein [Candidatus Terrybacteria bacterium]